MLSKKPPKTTQQETRVHEAVDGLLESAEETGKFRWPRWGLAGSRVCGAAQVRSPFALRE